MHLIRKQTVLICSVTIDVNCYHLIRIESTRFFYINKYFVGGYFDSTSCFTSNLYSVILIFINTSYLNHYYYSVLPSADFQIYFSFWIY